LRRTFRGATGFELKVKMIDSRPSLDLRRMGVVGKREKRKRNKLRGKRRCGKWGWKYLEEKNLSQGEREPKDTIHIYGGDRDFCFLEDCDMTPSECPGWKRGRKRLNQPFR